MSDSCRSRVRAISEPCRVKIVFDTPKSAVFLMVAESNSALSNREIALTVVVLQLGSKSNFNKPLSSHRFPFSRLLLLLLLLQTLSLSRQQIFTDFAFQATMDDPSSIFFPRQLFDRFATWIGASVSYAFFSSLDRFSCVNVAASDGEEDDIAEESEDPQLTRVNSSKSNVDENLPPV